MKYLSLSLCGIAIALLAIGCIGGDDDSLAPQGPSYLRIYSILPARADYPTRVFLDDSLIFQLYIPEVPGPVLEIPSGRHSLSFSLGDSLQDFRKDFDFVPRIHQLLVLSDPEPFLVSDRIPSGYPNQTLLRVINALAINVGIDVEDQYGTPYFVSVPQNRAAGFRTVNLYGNCTMQAYLTDSQNYYLAGQDFVPHPDSAYTLVVYGLGKYMPTMRLIADPVSSQP